MTLNAVPQLPPAIPPPDTSANHAWMITGQKECYILQLQTEMLRRAQETNELHDAAVALTGKQTALEEELRVERDGRIALEALLADWKKQAGNQVAELEKTLAAVRNERDELRNELQVQNLARQKDAQA